MKTVAEYNNWFTNAAPGSIFVYHIGTHLFDLQARKREVANAAWKDSQLGNVFLTQKRMSNGLFAYRAMKTNKKLKRLIASWKREDEKQ